MNHPTPQFVPVLNRLAETCPEGIHVYYRDATDRNRGWGDLSIRHPYSLLTSSRWLNLRMGLSRGLSRDTSRAVVLGYSAPFAIGLLLGTRLTRKPIYTQSDSSYRQHLRHSRIFRLVKFILVRTLYSSTTRVWTIGNDNARYWRSLRLNNQEPTTFESPIPVPTNLVNAADRLRDELCGGAEIGVVLYVGRLSPEKRLEDVIGAVELMTAAGTACRLVIAGGAMPGYELVTDNPEVVFVGPVDHDRLAAFYEMADVLVLASEREQYGLVVSEALQFGLPIVATDVVPSAAELCDLGWNRVPIRSPRDLATALLRAFGERQRWPRRPPADNREFYVHELALRQE